MDALDPNIVLYAYTRGVFPMSHPEEGNEVYWHNPEWRGIIPLDAFKAPKNIWRKYRNHSFQFSINYAFEKVIRACAERDSTWISEEIIDCYCQLHEMGSAHSFEVWKENSLVGGLYGIAMGRAFFGESMFHKVTDASKLALIYLVEYLNEKGFMLLDTQYLNPHLLQFGAKEIPRSEYLELLKDALK